MLDTAYAFYEHSDMHSSAQKQVFVNHHGKIQQEQGSMLNKGKGFERVKKRHKNVEELVSFFKT